MSQEEADASERAREAHTPSPLRPYVSTGKTPLVGLLAGITAGACAAIVLAHLYVLGTVYIPIVQVEFLLTAGFGAAIGWVTAHFMHRFKVRSRALIMASSLGLASIGWLFSWLVWLDHTFGDQVGMLDLANPFMVIGLVAQVFETGTWSVGSSLSGAVNGLPLAAVWLVEAVIILVGAAFVAQNETHDRVFCERCESWCSVHPDRRFFDVSESESLLSGLVERGDWTVLSMAKDPTTGGQWLSLKLGVCDGCHGTNVVAVDHITQSFDNRGNEVRTPKVFIAYHCITHEQMTALRSQLGC